MRLEFVLKCKCPSEKRQGTFLWSSCSVWKHIFHRPAELRPCVSKKYVERPKFTCIQLAYWFFFSHSFILSVGGLFGVNQGLRPYADTCGAFEYVCTVYADADVLCRSQTVIEPCTVSEFFLYIWSAVCECATERERYMYI